MCLLRGFHLAPQRLRHDLLEDVNDPVGCALVAHDQEVALTRLSAASRPVRRGRREELGVRDGHQDSAAINEGILGKSGGCLHVAYPIVRAVVLMAAVGRLEGQWGEVLQRAPRILDQALHNVIDAQAIVELDAS